MGKSREGEGKEAGVPDTTDIHYIKGKNKAIPVTGREGP
jgi:hypothetical protein